MDRVPTASQDFFCILELQNTQDTSFVSDKSTGSMKALGEAMRQSLAVSCREGREEGLSAELIVELRPKKMKTSQSLKGPWQYFPG